MSNHETYLRRAINLAKLGQGNVAPNPMVGAVIVHQDTIIGEGYHKKYGEAHAEVNAVNSVKDKSLLQKSTIYVTLEPCAHFGKTPPCANLILDTGIPKVVIGCRDSFEKVDGKGIEILKNAGINVNVGILEKECLELNKRFFTFHSKRRPFVILKWAEDELRFMDIDRDNGEKGSHWITQPETKLITHTWRSEEAAILIGRKTVENDNPSLTCREIAGENPVRVVIDQKMKLDYGAFKVGDRQVKSYVLTEKGVRGSGNLQFIKPVNFSPKEILNTLHELNIQSVIIEGGKQTLEQFISTGLWDEARILIGSNLCGKGLKSPEISGQLVKKEQYGLDTIKYIVNA